MRKILLAIVIMNTLIYASSIKNNWTIILQKISHEKVTQGHIEVFVKSNVDVFLLKKPNVYLVAYGAFDSYLSAEKSLKSSPKAKGFTPYIYNSQLDLSKYIKEEKKKENPSINLLGSKKLEKNKKIIFTNPVNYKKMRENKKNLSIENKLILSIDYTPIVFSGKLKYGVNNPNIDYKEDLGIEDNGYTFIPLISIKNDYHTLLMSYFSSNYEKTNKLNKAIVLNTDTYNSGSTIKTTIDTSWKHLGYRYNYYNTDIGFDIHMFDSNVQIENTKIDGSYIYHALSFDKKHYLNDNIISYGGSFGMGSEVDYTSYYFAAGTKVSFINNLNILFGYKVRNLDIKDEIYTSEVSYNGFYLNFTKAF